MMSSHACAILSSISRITCLIMRSGYSTRSSRSLIFVVITSLIRLKMLGMAHSLIFVSTVHSDQTWTGYMIGDLIGNVRLQPHVDTWTRGMWPRADARRYASRMNMVGERGGNWK